MGASQSSYLPAFHISHVWPVEGGGSGEARGLMGGWGGVQNAAPIHHPQAEQGEGSRSGDELSLLNSGKQLRSLISI